MSSRARVLVALTLALAATACGSEQSPTEAAAPAEPVVANSAATAEPAATTATAAEPAATAATAAEPAATTATAAEPAATAAEPAATAAEPAATTAAEPADRRVVDARLARTDLDAALANPTEIARNLRIVPAIRDGKAVGFKLYAIRKPSLIASLGFENGDTIESVNGHALTSPDKALDVYVTLREVDRLDVDLTRRGQPLRIRVVIE